MYWVEYIVSLTTYYSDDIILSRIYCADHIILSRIYYIDYNIFYWIKYILLNEIYSIQWNIFYSMKYILFNIFYSIYCSQWIYESLSIEYINRRYYLLLIYESLSIEYIILNDIYYSQCIASWRPDYVVEELFLFSTRQDPPRLRSRGDPDL
jgi:hypothetical protein